MPITITPNFVAAFVRQGESLLMVEHQGADDPAPYWALPGGRVEAGETARDALLREVREESGLHVLEIGALAFRVQVVRDGHQTEAHIYEVTEFSGRLAVHDPDEKVLRATFIPLSEALAAFDRVDYRPMSEPPMTYLSGAAAAGALWRYAIRDDGSVRLISRH